MSIAHQDYEFEVDTVDELDHEHDDDCRQCSRDGCPHLSCDHEDFENGCERGGCLCGRWLADGDCPACDGYGEVWFDVEAVNGAVRESSIRCHACGGRGAR